LDSSGCVCLLTGFATCGVIIDVEDTRRVEVEGASGALVFSVRRSMRVEFSSSLVCQQTMRILDVMRLRG